ncbi:50S ribosome-binding GTPase [Klebsiella pneumoniae subsp. pneumoniae]|nr:50S ribosome-binding GTPase [Klebsiella pneumoniae subsp. pneumoniae]
MRARSSLCNALFQQPVCLTSDLLGCTREPQRLLLTVGERSMTLVDLPGWARHRNTTRNIWRSIRRCWQSWI